MSTSVSVVGRELIAAWSKIDRGVAAWVLQLAAFDESREWAEDGYAACVNWLVDKCGLARSSAYEKLKVSRELARRPVVRAAFEAGLPYSKTRLLTRLEGLDDERDADYVKWATTDSVRMVEERVLTWNYYAGQEKKPPSTEDHYGMVRQRGFGEGMGRVIIEAPDAMLDRLFALLDAYGDYLYFNPRGAPPTLGLGQVGEQSAMQTNPDHESAMQTDAEPQDPPERRPFAARRLDCLFDLLEEVALASPEKIDPYRASVGVVVPYEDLVAGTGRAETAQGSVVRGAALRQMCCDANLHRVVVNGASEIIDFGRDRRLFTRAQRRAIRFGHSHVCAVRGCSRWITQIHHVKPFEVGGLTDIVNGLPLCSFHHHLVHDDGWLAEWDPFTGSLVFTGPKRQRLETTRRYGEMAA